MGEEGRMRTPPRSSAPGDSGERRMIMRKAMYPKDHEAYNAKHYPGTRQLCIKCNEPTERCEEDAIYLDDGTGPLCPECFHGAIAQEEKGG